MPSLFYKILKVAILWPFETNIYQGDWCSWSGTKAGKYILFSTATKKPAGKYSPCIFLLPWFPLLFVCDTIRSQFFIIKLQGRKESLCYLLENCPDASQLIVAPKWMLLAGAMANCHLLYKSSVNWDVIDSWPCTDCCTSISRYLCRRKELICLLSSYSPSLGVFFLHRIQFSFQFLINSIISISSHPEGFCTCMKLLKLSKCECLSSTVLARDNINFMYFE